MQNLGAVHAGSAWGGHQRSCFRYCTGIAVMRCREVGCAKLGGSARAVGAGAAAGIVSVLQY